MKANFNNKINFNKTNFVKILATVLFVGYVLVLVYLTFFSRYYGREVVRRSINVMPFSTIIEFLSSIYTLKNIITNLVGNIVAFIPMGFLLPIVFRKLDRFRKVVLVSAVATLLIEVAQYIFGVGTSDIDDVILNVLGAIVGYLAFRLFSLGSRRLS